MNTVTNFMAASEKQFADISAPFLNNPVIAILLTWLVLVNIIMSVEELPQYIKNILSKGLFKFPVTFIGFYMATGKLYISLAGTLILLGLFYGAKSALEAFELVSPESNVYPGCSKITLDDLLSIFDGNKEQLAKAMYASGVPLNLKLNNNDAPLIATYLINFGYSVNGECTAPADK